MKQGYQLQTFTGKQVSGTSAIASMEFSRIKFSWVLQKPQNPHILGYMVANNVLFH